MSGAAVPRHASTQDGPVGEKPLQALIDALTRGGASLPGQAHGWLLSKRAAALQQLRRGGLPSQREEDWKYTSVRAIERRSFQCAPTTSLADVERLVSLAGAEQAACTLLFVDGRLAGRRGDAPAGVTLMGLAQALEERGAELQALLGSVADASSNGFAALNAASLADGAYLHVAADVALHAPVHLVFATSGTDHIAALPRNVLWLERGARAHVVEHYMGTADTVYLTDSVTEIVLDADAELEHTRLQDESRRAYHIGSIDVRQDAGSRLVSHALSLGAALARQDINTRLTAPGAHATLNGLYLAFGRQHVDFHTRIHHIAEDCGSEQCYKGVLGGHGRGVFNGQIHVHPHAQRSDAQQSNHNLLLSRDAEIDTKPQLEIQADDVRCSHGTTVGQLDPQMLFYLRSRGIPDAQARSLLTYGFAHDIVERLSLEALRTRIEQLVLEALPQGVEPRKLP